MTIPWTPVLKHTFAAAVGAFFGWVIGEAFPANTGLAVMLGAFSAMSGWMAWELRTLRHTSKQVLTELAEARDRAEVAMIDAARNAVANGSGHDCGEWIDDGKCQLCDRDLRQLQ